MVYYSSERFYRFIFLCLLYWPREGLLYYYYPTIFWSPDNCRFNNHATGKIFEFDIKANSHLFFVCPNHAIWTDMGNKSPHYGRMYENLILVDKVGFETCTVDKKKDPHLNREIFRCDKNPQKFTYTEEIFSSQRAFNNKMKYECGETYYFISTSDGTIESLNNTSGGHCATHQMKLKVKVCPKEGPCEFKMPKCPYNNVFDAMDKPTTRPKSTVSAVITTSPKNTTSPSTPGKNIAGVVPSHNSPNVVRANADRQNPVVPSDEPDTNAQSSMRSGTYRKHVIIHITMALVIMVLVLCLLYVLITRRRKTEKESICNGRDINSRLFLERPLSMEPISLEMET